MKKKFTISVTYSWGDEEPNYGCFDSEEEAFQEACKLVGEEMYVQNEEFEEYKTASVYVDAFNKRIDLIYDIDGETCYYRIVEIQN